MKTNLVLGLGLLLLVGVGYWLSGERGRVPEQVVTVPDQCRFSAEPCAVVIGGRSIVFRVMGQAAPLVKFTIEVRGAGLERVSADFEMKGMQMGSNRYLLKRGSGGRWRVDVMLPVCASGRRDWLAHYDIQLEGSMRYRVVYPFSM